MTFKHFSLSQEEDITNWNDWMNESSNRRCDLLSEHVILSFVVYSLVCSERYVYQTPQRLETTRRDIRPVDCFAVSRSPTGAFANPKNSCCKLTSRTLECCHRRQHWVLRWNQMSSPRLKIARLTALSETAQDSEERRETLRLNQDEEKSRW